MFKVEILLDEEKIKEKGEYTPESIYEAIQKNFELFDLQEIPTEDNTIVYRDKGRSKDYGGMWRVINVLYDADWCKPYLIKCMWYSDEEYENGELYSENVLENFAKFDAKGIKK
ncbi:MAG: hypothetical protein UHK60_09800 [Acutalibacteraceae bacterium]|nr:hypothetical protein [Acutalibacteraceae bacterium]